MRYEHVVQGRFVRRLNRFAAEVEIGGRAALAHVKNTGRLKELLVPGAELYLETSRNAGRKYAHSLIAVRKDGMLVNIDSQAPNAVVEQALREGKVKEIGDVRTLKREAAYGNSRFDIYYEGDGRKGFIEVKGVTLFKGDTALFPDAPTKRGTKHVQQLAEAAHDGYEGILFFLIQARGCRRFAPNAEMDGEFADAVRQAARRGVRVLAYDASVTESSMAIGKPLQVVLD